MKIAYVAPYAGEAELARSLAPEHEFVFLDTPLRDSIPREITDVELLSVFVDSRVTPTMIDALPKLRHIALRSTGFDHVAVTHARQRGIMLSYVPHYGSQTVAEYTFALMLALSRRVYPAYDLLRTEGKVDVARFEGFDLCGKTLGVIGTGAIGRRVCELAKGFRMRLLACDKFPNDDCVRDCGVAYCDYNHLFAESDIITLHIPSAPENRHLINAATLAQCKPGVIIINTARGDLVDTVALTMALRAGQVAAAGLDVYEGEQFIADEAQLLGDQEISHDVWRAFAAEHELLDMEQVIVTPHLAFNTREAKREITETTLANIIRMFTAGSPQFSVPV